MSFSGPSFVLLIIGMSLAAWVATTWIRARHGYPLEDEWGGKTERAPGADRAVELLSQENAALTGKLARLEERLAVLERITTEREGSTARLAHEIDRLRD